MKIIIFIIFLKYSLGQLEIDSDTPPPPDPVELITVTAPENEATTQIALENITAAIEMGYKPFGFRMQPPTKYAYLRPCWMNFWGQFKKEDSNGYSLSLLFDYQKGMCTHLILELEWLQDEIIGKNPIPVATPEVTSLQCGRIRKIASTIGLETIEMWTTNYCDFIEVFTAGMTCAEVLNTVKSCMTTPVTVSSNSFNPSSFLDKMIKVKMIDPDVKMMLSISTRTFGADIFTELMNSTQRTAFMHATIEWMTRQKMDGIALDWDHSMWEKNNHTTFVKEMRSRLSEAEILNPGKEYEIALILPGDKQILVQQYDLQAIHSLVNFSLLMPFNTSELWMDDFKLWHQKRAAEYCVEQGFSPKQIILGIPTFGLGWKISNCGGIENGLAKEIDATIPSFTEICDLIQNGTTSARDMQSDFDFPYLIEKDEPSGPRRYYADQRTVAKMVHFIKKMSYGGIAVIQPQFDDILGKCDPLSHQPYPMTSLIAWELAGIRLKKHESIEQDFFEN